MRAERLRVVWEVAKAKEMTSACARHIDVESERNFRISASRTCRTTVAGWATGLTRLSLIYNTRQLRSTAASTNCTASSA